MPAVEPADEYRHDCDPEVELWNESYYLDWFAEDLSVGGYVRIGFYPNLGKVWYWACLVGEGRPLVTVIDHEVDMPSSSSSLEIRHDGLWADHAIETPNEHMSVNLEAFALALDDPASVYGDPRGDRVPFGFELDFLTDRGAYMWPPVTPRYEIPCRVQGEVLVGDEKITVDGWGQRDHSWGAARDWWSNQWSWTAGRLEDSTRFHGVGGFFPGEDWGVAYRLDPHTSEFVDTHEVSLDVTEGRERLPETTRIGYCDLDFTVTPLAFSPVGLFHPEDGRLARFPRALARFDAADGRTGGGWIEWNQPPVD
ncbi:MAG: hypothetical protein GY812_03170 [Actinomycetia bacterium]|nr:hypothetical protein [Actinomycetes bacterium]